MVSCSVQLLQSVLLILRAFDNGRPDFLNLRLDFACRQSADPQREVVPGRLIISRNILKSLTAIVA